MAVRHREECLTKGLLEKSVRDDLRSEEFSKMDALHRLVWNILDAEEEDQGNGKILIFANGKRLCGLTMRSGT